MISVPVLLYHHVAPDREVTPEGFAAQMSWLRDSGLRTLSVAELIAHVTGERPAPEGSLAVTFDDGYADNWIYAYPALRRLGLRASVYAVTGRVGEGPARATSEEGGAAADTRTSERGPEGFLRWSELAAMSRDGVVEAGSHTHTHRDFVRERPFDDALRELADSARLLAERLPAWCGAVAWPWGDYDEAWLALAAEAGYRAALTTRVGANRPGDGPWAIRRFKVRNGDPAWLERRLWLYRRGILAEAYGRIYGLEGRIKSWGRRA